MARTVWHKRYHGDAINGYMGLTLEQRGAYTTLLDLMYDSDWALGIPDRDRWIAGHLNVSVRRWRTLRDDLITAGKIDLVDGMISNKRYRIERENAANLSRKRAENGASGGEKSGETRRKAAENRLSGEANASDLPLYARATESESESEEKKNNNDDDDSRPAREPKNAVDPFGDIGDLTARCGRAAGVAVMPNRTSFASQLDTVREWVGMGLDPDTEIIPTLERDALGDHPPRHSLKYFTPAMAQIAARKDAQANGRHHDRPDIRGSRPDPALDMLRAAERAEDAERAARGGPDRRGTRLALPSRQSGRP